MEPNSFPPSKRCLICRKVFFKKPSHSRKAWKIRTKYCSLECRSKNQIGRPVWNTDIKIDRSKYPNMGHFQKHTTEALEKITIANRANAKKNPKSFYQEMQKLAIIAGKARGSYKGTLGMTGKKSYMWIGDKATYNSKHRWIQNHWPKTGICEDCGDKPVPRGRLNIGTKWANMDGKYNRDDRNSWKELCPKCHMNYDHPTRYKGSEKNYYDLHYWVRKNLGSPDACSHCGLSGFQGKKIHWANKSGLYKREVDDWIRLCGICHSKYDSR